MNALFKLQSGAGQKVHEQLYGARLRILGAEIPCTAAGYDKDFMLEMGRSIANFVSDLRFRLDAFASPPALSAIDKELPIELKLPNTTEFLLLKLGAGGLLADGITYKFIAYDRNFRA